METFLAWARDRGISSPFVGVKKTEFAGHGVFANKDASCSDVLLHIPRPMLLTATRVLDQDNFRAAIQPLLEDPMGPHMERICISLFLIYNKKMEDSPWKPYLDILPTVDTFRDQQVLFRPDTVAGTSLEAAVNAKRLALERELVQLQKRVPLEWVLEIDIDTWTWSNITFWSRVVQLSGSDEEEQDEKRLALVPFFDFANHSLEPNMRWQLDCSGLNLVPNCSQGLSKGVELTLSYGEKSNQELLFLHGFCYSDNPTGSRITLPVEPFVGDDMRKAEWLKQHISKPILTLTEAGISTIAFPPGHTLFEMAGWSATSIAMMYLVALDEDDGLRFANQSTQTGGIDAFMGDEHLLTLNDIMRAVDTLIHTEVIQLRVVLTLLDAVTHHLQRLEEVHSFASLDCSPFEACVQRYKAEEAKIFDQTYQELCRLRDILSQHEVVQDYLQSMQQEDLVESK